MYCEKQKCIVRSKANTDTLQISLLHFLACVWV